MIPSPPNLGSPYVVLTATAAVVTAGVAAVALYNRRSPGAGWLSITMFLGALVAAFAVLGHRVPPEGQVAAGLAVGALGLLAVVPFVAFVVTYTGRGRHLTYPTLLGYGGPVLVAAALYATTPYHDLVLVGPIDVRTVAGITLVEYVGFGPLLAPLGLYVVLLLVGALLLVLQTLVRHDRLYLGQSAALTVGAAAPLGTALMVGVAAPLGAPFVVVGDLQLFGAGVALLGIASLGFGYAVVRQRLFDFVPAVRQIGGKAAIDDLEEGLLVVDANDNVVDLNASAETILGCEGRLVVGSAAERLFGAVGVDDSATTPTTFERANRTYELTSSAITDGRERRIGRTFVLRDVTRRELRKQRLQVLNRVLRHNVRNDMSVIKMNAGLIAEEGGPRLAELGRTMNDVADDLVAIGEKVRRIENLLARESLTITDVEVETLAESVVDDVVPSVKSDTVRITVDSDAGTVAVDHALLELALENVIENAIEHNDSDRPRVAVTADRLGGGVRLTVADDGPGVPDNELVALDAGRETDLQHASSLGLWLVLWSVERLGGDLRIERLHPRGSAVSIWVPDHDEGRAGSDAETQRRNRDRAPDQRGDGLVDERRGEILESAGVEETAVTTVAESVLDEVTAGEKDASSSDGDDAPERTGGPDRTTTTGRTGGPDRTTTTGTTTRRTKGETPVAPPPAPASARVSTGKNAGNEDGDGDVEGADGEEADEERDDGEDPDPDEVAEDGEGTDTGEDSGSDDGAEDDEGTDDGEDTDSDEAAEDDGGTDDEETDDGEGTDPDEATEDDEETGGGEDEAETDGTDRKHGERISASVEDAGSGTPPPPPAGPTSTARESDDEDPS